MAKCLLFYLPKVFPPLQLITLSQFADLVPDLSVQAVGAGTAVLLPHARSAQTASLPLLLLRYDRFRQFLTLRVRQGEETRLLMLRPDVVGRRRHHPRVSGPEKNFGVLLVQRELIYILDGRTGPSSQLVHTKGPALFWDKRAVKAAADGLKILKNKTCGSLQHNTEQSIKCVLC